MSKEKKHGIFDGDPVYAQVIENMKAFDAEQSREYDPEYQVQQAKVARIAEREQDVIETAKAERVADIKANSYYQFMKDECNCALDVFCEHQQEKDRLDGKYWAAIQSRRAAVDTLIDAEGKK